jgi:beta-xylosidase
VTRARFSSDGPGLGLIEYGDSATYPSEVYKLDWTTGKNQTIFRDKRYAITDVWLTKDGTSYLAGVEMTGQVRSIVPGNIKVFKSSDMKNWNEMAVDYRAVGRRATLSGADEQNLWLATDSGMILKLK